MTGQLVKKHDTDDIVACMRSYSPGTRFTVLAPFIVREGRTLQEQLTVALQQGFARVEVKGEVMRIEDLLEQIAKGSDVNCQLNVVIDRLSADDSKEAISRLIDSTETAFYEGGGTCMLRFYPAGILHTFSKEFEADGITFEEPTEQLFSFNSPVGACPTCGGFGRVIGIDEQLVIPNSALSVYDGCVVCWRGDKMSAWRDEFIHLAAKDNFPIFTPYYELTQAQKDYLWHGPRTKPCIDSFFKMLEENQYKIQYRVMLARYRGKTLCPTCRGSRLKKEAEYVKICGRNICELVDMPVTELHQFFATLTLDEHDAAIAKRLLVEINSRLQFLLDVGLGYLKLGQSCTTLSGGESQRIKLSSELAKRDTGRTLYIFDEPTTGLHFEDIRQLLAVFNKLVERGNSVIIIEHNLDVIKCADWIVDMGPEGGKAGGYVVATGTPEEVAEVEESYTGAFLREVLG